MSSRTSRLRFTAAAARVRPPPAAGDRSAASVATDRAAAGRRRERALRAARAPRLSSRTQRDGVAGQRHRVARDHPARRRQLGDDAGRRLPPASAATSACALLRAARPRPAAARGGTPRARPASPPAARPAPRGTRPSRPPHVDLPVALERGERGPQRAAVSPSRCRQAIDRRAGDTGIGDQLPQCGARVAVGSLVPRASAAKRAAPRGVRIPIRGGSGSSTTPPPIVASGE